MKIAGALLLAAVLVAPLHAAHAQNPPPTAGVPARCWVDLPNGGTMVIPHAGTQTQCAAAAKQCLGLKAEDGVPRGVVHHSTEPRIIGANPMAECEVTGQ